MPESHSTDDIIHALSSSDAGLARVTEDLIAVLVRKGTILFTDLPETVQTKLLAREALRSQLGEQSVSPLSDDETL
ncbi:MAG: hypothetical protein ACMZ63_10825 [Methylotenera sp.]